MPRKPKTQPQTPESLLRLQADPWQALHSHPKDLKDLLQSPGWAHLKSDLSKWRDLEVGNLVRGDLTPQALGQIQGVIRFIDILLRA